MAQKNGILTVYAQAYIRDVFAKRLREEGFSSLNQDDIAWYRIVNGELIQTVYFYCRFTETPMFLYFGIGCHPAYIEPLFPSGVYQYALPRSWEVLHQHLLVGNTGNANYSPTIPIQCPSDEYHGLDLLEKELTTLNSITTEQACYDAHKAFYSDKSLHMISAEFIDEVIYHQDYQLYESCRIQVETLIKQRKCYALTAKNKKLIAHLDLQKNALETGDFSEILEHLEARRLKIAKTLMKKVGI